MAKVHIFGESVQGASHSRVDKICQDSNKIDSFGQGIYVIAVADGHGSDKCPYSDEGSFSATKVFCKLLIDYYKKYKDKEALQLFLQTEGEIKIAQTIDLEWKKLIKTIHNKKNRDEYDDEFDIYKLYGTTLLGLAITDTFVFAFQVGDGDITYIDANGVSPVITDEKILGVETHSLSKKESWKKALTKLIVKNQDYNLPYMFMLTTDGFANSFISEEEFHKNCNGYYDMVKEHSFAAVKDNLGTWLKETSEQGCGDDITAVLAYFEE